MTVPNPAIGMPSDEQKKQIEEWHQRLPKCGCGRVGRYETSTGLACNKYMRCDNAEFMAAQIEQLRAEVAELNKHYHNGNLGFKQVKESSELRAICNQMGEAMNGAALHYTNDFNSWTGCREALSAWRQWKGESK